MSECVVGAAPRSKRGKRSHLRMSSAVSEDVEDGAEPDRPRSTAKPKAPRAMGVRLGHLDEVD